MAEEQKKQEEGKIVEFEEMQDFFDVPHTVTIIIGRTTMTISELLQLDTGSIVELTKSAGESFDVLANGKLIAHGDVTVVEDRFGVRITDLAELGRRRG